MSSDDEEARRRKALRRYHVLDTGPEPAFDRLVRIAARTLGVPIALISFLETDRPWCKAAFGLDPLGMPASAAFCALAIRGDRPLVVPDATADERFADDALVVGPPFVRSYAGAPLITPSGERIGTLCAIDRKRRHYTDAELETLGDLADVVIDLLEKRLSKREQEILSRVAEIAPSGAYVFDVQRGELTWTSPGLSRLIGVTPETVTQEALLANVHPDDRELARYDATHAGDLESLVFRRFREGLIHWFVSNRAVLERDGAGAVRSVVGVLTDVTAARHAEERAERSEQALAERVLVLEGILDTAAEGILYATADGKLEIANARAKELRGTSGIGMSADEEFVRFAGIFERDGVTPHAPEMLPLMRALRGERVDAHRLFVKNEHVPEGVHLQTNARVLRDAGGARRGAVATLTDVTALVAAEKRLESSLENLRAITEAAPVGLLVQRGPILYANHTFARMLGRERSSLIGIHYSELVDPRDREMVAERARRVEAGGTNGPAEVRLLGADGVVVVEATSIRIEFDGQEAILGLCRDTTVESAARLQMEASLREKDALLKEIHHRVKNNLAVVSSLLFMQSRASPDPRLREAFAESQRRIESIALVHEHLYRSNTLARVDLGRYVRSVAIHLAPSLGAEERGISIIIEIDPTEVDLDSAMPCGLIVNELVTNALKHAFPNRGGTITVGVHHRGHEIELSVSDTGCGFDPESVHPGALGLQLVRDLCHQLRARLSIEHTGGARITIHFEKRN